MVVIYVGSWKCEFGYSKVILREILEPEFGPFHIPEQ